MCEGFLSELLARVLAEKRASATGWYVEPHDVQRALAGMLGAQEAELVHAAGRWSEPARQPKGQRAWAADEQDLAPREPRSDNGKASGGVEWTQLEVQAIAAIVLVQAG